MLKQYTIWALNSNFSPTPSSAHSAENNAYLRERVLSQDQSRISLVAASPLTRAIQTAFSTFQPALENGKCEPKIFAIPETQEIPANPCDTGLSPEALRERCVHNGWPVELDLVEDGWNIKIPGSKYAPEPTAVKVRARAARRILRQKIRELVEQGDEDVNVVLVSHGGYLHFITDDWEDSLKLNGTG